MVYDIQVYQVLISMIYPLVSSNMAGWNIPELNGDFNSKSLINGPFSVAIFDYRRVFHGMYPPLNNIMRIDDDSGY